jgi:SWI/SNF-related matrix-associated actin-dependent regulator 1 of chromatin subfamily A
MDSKVRFSLGNDADKEADLMHRISSGNDINHVATYRRLLGIEKARLSVDYVRHLVEETASRVLVFAYHTEAISILRQNLKDLAPLCITGETPPAARQAIVDEYQKNDSRKLLIGNYVAMGIGFTLTKANRVLFVEFDWVPGVNKQAEDRAHRIGQNEMVIVQYVALRNSLDLAVIDSILRKERAISYI